MKLNLGLHGSARGNPKCGNPKYHGWKSVDCSTPAYHGSATNSLNATDGNPWIVQIQPALLTRLPLHDECSQPIFGSEVPHLIAPYDLGKVQRIRKRWSLTTSAPGLPARTRIKDNQTDGTARKRERINAGEFSL
jgi:hypothetical protein